MKKQLSLAAILILGFSMMGEMYAQVLQAPRDYKVKTYLFLYNSFVEEFGSKIDTLNYTSEIHFKDGRMVWMQYPRFLKEFQRTETYQYGEFGGIEKIVTSTRGHSTSLEKDSIIDHYKKENKALDRIVTASQTFNREQRYTITGDTTHIDEYFNGEYGFTVREIKQSEKIKIVQIIKPELSEIINAFHYDELGNELKYVKTENGNTEETMSFQYTFDQFNRILRKETFIEPEHTLMSTEIRIYE